MSEINNTTKKEKKQYHHLTKKQRITIENLHNLGYTITFIANYVGVHKSTVSRELRFRIKSKIMIRSGKIKNLPYSAESANEDYLFKRSMSKDGGILEKHPKMKEFIIEKIKKDKWSPDATVGYMKTHGYFERNGFCHISTQALYYDIRNGLTDLSITDTRRMKPKAEYNYHTKNELSESKAPYSINNRPEEINSRLTFGHFELDTVIGTSKGKHECLMTLTERKSRFEIIFKIKCKTAEEVVNKFNQIKLYLKNNYNKIFKSLTTDNGTEFSDFLSIINGTKTKIYFCHPYCSGEKGTNEKHNSMIRYFIPKKTLMENYSFDDINNIANWMNNYPRKILNYKTPLEAVQEEFNDKNILNKLYKIQEKLNYL